MKQELVLQKKDISKSISQITSEIIANNPATTNIAVIGIRTRGAVLAERLAKKIKSVCNVEIPIGILDITLYRDDLGVNQQPVVYKTEINFDVSDKRIILVDDVLYTGRTIRAALDAIIDFGRPKQIELMVLIDRGHRELPISANYVGKYLETSPEDQVLVKLKELDDDECVYVIKS